MTRCIALINAKNLATKKIKATHSQTLDFTMIDGLRRLRNVDIQLV